MGIIEKYSRATQSSNLRSDEHHHDVDKLAAVALSSEFGSLLFRVKYANDPTSYVQLVKEWEWYVKKRAALAGWPMAIDDEAVAKTSLKYWLNDICPACGGTGHAKEEFQDVLSDEPCNICEGSGKKPLECNRHIKKYVEEMVSALEGMTIVAGGQAIAKLASDFEL